ncbi:MAG: AAA family ATPase [Planctomycetaceae bacterium]|nr:AAA family ATPase [Planctomycetaceae bacterium]
MKNLFITSTRHNEGKTLVTLGLTAALGKRVRSVGYMKPLGKGSVEFAGEKIDHDAVLVKEACGIPAFVRDMGPVCYDGFPTQWISPEGREAVVKKIQSSFARCSSNRELMVIEGTGNAAAGAAFGLSNAFMAKLLDAKVVLVASGGVGQPTDEIFLNKNFFDKAGVEVVGAVVNKAYPTEFARIDQWMRRALEAMGVRLLGVIPYEEDLARATMSNLFERFRGRILNGEAGLGEPLGKVVLGAMSAPAALEHLTGQVTLICPADREDILVSALSAMYLSGRKDFTLASAVVTGKGKLSETVTKMIRRTAIPVLQVEQDAYSVVAEVHAGNFKILPGDTAKIDRAMKIVQDRVDLGALLDGLRAS